MSRQRWLSVSLVVLTSLPWSISLAVMGLWLIGEPHSGMLESRVVSVSAGIAALCAGQVVFLLCIADRVFPRAHQVMVRTIEGLLGAIFLGSAGVLAVVSVAVAVVG